MKLGIQVSSLKPLLNTPEQVDQVFARMAQMGCRWVQLQWIDPAVSPEDIAAALNRHGLRSVSVQDFCTSIRETLEYYVNLNQRTGAGGSVSAGFRRNANPPRGWLHLPWSWTP